MRDNHDIRIASMIVATEIANQMKNKDYDPDSLLNEDKHKKYMLALQIANQGNI